MADINYDTLSDEEMLTADFAALEKDTDHGEETSEESTDEAGTEPAESEDIVDEDNQDLQEGIGETEEVVYDTGSDTGTQDESDGTEEELEEEPANPDVMSAEDFMTQVTAPFKAVNKMMSVSKPEDVIRLMQQGIDYNRKMGTIKPQLKLIKMLQNNDLVDEQKLSHLIDISKGNHGAIKKAITDSGYEESYGEDDTEYAPSTYTVSDESMALDDVLKNIEGTETYDTVLDILSTKWDNSSRQRLYNNPNELMVINEQISSGAYAKITEEVEHRRMMGSLPTNLLDIQAYELVAEELYPLRAPTQSAPRKKAYSPTPSNVQNPQLTNRKKGLASPANKKQVRKVATEVDYSTLTDEQLMAI